MKYVSWNDRRHAQDPSNSFYVERIMHGDMPIVKYLFMHVRGTLLINRKRAKQETVIGVLLVNYL